MHFLIIALLLLLPCSFSVARVLRVPAEYVTIQAALDSLHEADTVLVDVGVYAEELLAPPLSFVLKGEVVADTAIYPRPVIDPSTLSLPQTRRCMVLPPGCRPTIEDFIFRNGASMYPREYAACGGIERTNDYLELRRCVFDSTHGGISSHWAGSGVTAHLWQCQFIDVQTQPCFFGRELRATDCLFSGHGTTLVTTSRNSIIERCVFRDNELSELFVANGPNVVVRDCVFGPSDPPWPPVASGGTTFQRCAFRHQGASSYPTPPEGYVKYAWWDTLSFLELNGCVFLDNHVASQVEIFEWDSSFVATQPVARICSTLFAYNAWAFQYGKAIQLNTAVTIERNRFVNLLPRSQPSIATQPDQQGPVTLRENLFEAADLALSSNSFEIDATLNWWGDASGPYHAATNPEGHGATIDGPASFTPWYTDTTFLAVERPGRSALPQAFSLAAFPNPFNGRVRIRLECAEPTIARLELYDVLGRSIKEVWAGVVVSAREVTVDAAGLPSGIYFARATDTVYNRSLATARLLLLR